MNINRKEKHSPTELQDRRHVSLSLALVGESTYYANRSSNMRL